jgi:hypothetical protein
MYPRRARIRRNLLPYPLEPRPAPVAQPPPCRRSGAPAGANASVISRRERAPIPKRLQCLRSRSASSPCSADCLATAHPVSKCPDPATPDNGSSVSIDPKLRLAPQVCDSEYVDSLGLHGIDQRVGKARDKPAADLSCERRTSLWIPDTARRAPPRASPLSGKQHPDLGPGSRSSRPPA